MKKIFNYLTKTGINEVIFDFKKNKLVNWSVLNEDGELVSIRTDVAEALLESSRNLITKTAKFSTVRVFPDTHTIISEISF